MTDTAIPNALNPDHPIRSLADDKLGYSRTAELLALAFLINDISKGFVIGVEGSWGSGKSSLVEMSLTSLAAAPNGPSIVRFAPWLVGDRDALLQHFFAELSPAIEERVPAPQRDTARAIIKRYGQLSGGFAAAATVLKKLGVPGAELAADLFQTTGDAAQDVAGKSLTQLNKELREQLETLDGYIVVFIDDLDRLEPKEVVEILRLVRAVADFPNIAYILAYDPDVLSHSLEKAIDVPDGRAYLEKMVQASFKIPVPMSFDLKNWLQAEADALFFPLDTLTDQAARLRYAIEEWTDRYITTPRDVVRVVNALKLYATPVRENIDPADMVFLQILRTQNPKLHAWVENYLVTWSVKGGLFHHERSLKDRIAEDLLHALDERPTEQALIIGALKDHLPGLGAELSGPRVKDEDARVTVFEGITANAENEAINARRLASPTHFRYYFAFSETAGTISDQVLRQFVTDCDIAHPAAIATFQQLTKEERPQGGRMAEILLERLRIFGREMTEEQFEGLFYVLGQTLDELAHATTTEYGQSSFLRGDRHQIFGLIAEVPADVRSRMLDHLFNTATALSWLAGIVISGAEDHTAADAKEREPLLTVEEFDTIQSIFYFRMTQIAAGQIQRAPQMLSILQAWDIAGGRFQLLEWVTKETKEDDHLIVFLAECATPKRTSPGNIAHMLSWQTAELLFEDIDQLLQRLESIATKADQSTWQKDRATVFLANLRKDEPQRPVRLKRSDQNATDGEDGRPGRT